MTEKQVLGLVRKKMAEAGSLRKLAKAWNVSPTALSRLLNGHYSPGPKILGPLGIERIETVSYRFKGDKL